MNASVLAGATAWQILHSWSERNSLLVVLGAKKKLPRYCNSQRGCGLVQRVVLGLPVVENRKSFVCVYCSFNEYQFHPLGLRPYGPIPSLCGCASFKSCHTGDFLYKSASRDFLLMFLKCLCQSDDYIRVLYLATKEGMSSSGHMPSVMWIPRNITVSLFKGNDDWKWGTGW